METSFLNTKNGEHAEDQERTSGNNELSLYVDYSHYFETVDSHIKIEIDDHKNPLRNEDSHLHNISNLNQNRDREFQNVNKGVKMKKETPENDQSCYENVDHTHDSFETRSTDSKSQDIDNLHKNMDTGLRNIKKEVMVKKENSDNIYIFENADSNFQDKDNLYDGMFVETLNIKEEIQNPEEQISEIEDKTYPECEKYNSNFEDTERSDLTIKPDSIGLGVKNIDVDNSYSTSMCGHSKSKNIPNSFEKADLTLESHMAINVTIDCANQIRVNAKDSSILKKHRCADSDCANQMKVNMKDSSILRKHQCADRPNVCNMCRKEFETISELREHMASHSIATTWPHPCQVCGRVFEAMRELRTHIASHTTHIGEQMTSESTERTHRCNVCQKQFKTKPYLQSHMIAHGTDRPHECAICEKRFKTTANLSWHLISHSNSRPHQCKVCQRQFQTKPYLQGHMITHGTERPHECDICEKRFKTRANLSWHMISHSNIRPHQCKVCQKQFKTKRNLLDHSMTHGTEMPYKCDICEKRFKTMSYFEKHRIYFHTDRSYKCSICEEVFETPYKRRQHRKSHRSLVCATLSRN